MSAFGYATEAGVIAVRGKDAVDLLHRLSTNDLSLLKESDRVASTIFTTNQGKIIDWCSVLSRADELLLKTAPGRAATIVDWITEYTIVEDVQVEDVTSSWKSFVFSKSVLDLPSVGDEQWVSWQEGLIYPRLGSHGAELEGLIPAEHAERVFALIPEEQRLEATDIERVRIEAGIPSPSWEYAEQVNPLELRMKDSISWNKGCYVGQEVIARMDSYDKVARLLMGIKTEDGAMAVGDRVVADDKPLGRITSVTEDGLQGLCVVKVEQAKPGPATIHSSQGELSAQRLDCPFWSQGD